MRKQRVKKPLELVSDYKNGMPICKLAKKYDLSDGGVYYYLRKYDAKRDRYEPQPEKKGPDIEARKKMLRARRNALMRFIEEVMLNVD